MAELRDFFLVALPGLEPIVRAEVGEWFADVQTTLEHGGITAQLPMTDGLAMNLVLKTPTRILLRVKHFRCRDFPKLFNTIKNLNWNDYVDPSCVIEAHASSRLSRVKIKNRIESTCIEAWQAFQKSKKITANPKKRLGLYVRFHKDECLLSLDTSGERLHKRGERTNIGEAPLRETIAAALIQIVERRASRERPVEIVDPMMGSGTFLLEASHRDQIIEKREFAFENFIYHDQVQPPTLAKERAKIRKVIGFEKDQKTFSAAEHNLRSSSVDVKLIREDFFEAASLPATEAQRWLLCNPPYGERLRVKEPLSELYERLFAASEKVAKPDLACFLLPSKAVKGKFLLPMGWKVLDKVPFSNGGIPVTAFVFGR